MTRTNDRNDLAIGDDLTITKTTRKAAGFGTWVRGRLNGHRFDALVFPEHAENPAWELGTSRISKLWIQRLADRRTVFHWERGLDTPAADATAQAIVDFLAAGLAEHTYGSEPSQVGLAEADGTPKVQFATAREALTYARESRPVAIRLNGANLVISQVEADRLAQAGVDFAYLGEVNGRIVTVPRS